MSAPLGPIRPPVQVPPQGDLPYREIPIGRGASFTDVLKTALNEVTELQEGAHQAIEAFLRGEPVELHQVMAATEEAGIALELLIEIRNKLTEAYRTVINMQT